MSERKRGAFTLVELLVVIGIIAILIGILLPTLSRVRESANRAVCLSDMRQLSDYLRLYGAQFNDVCPIGFIDRKALSYMLGWTNTTALNGNSFPRATTMGLIVEAGLCKNPKAFFCPSEPDGTYFHYMPNPPGGWSDNPWPFCTEALKERYTRMAYNSRPIANWPCDHLPGSSNPVPTPADKLFWLPSDGKGRLTLPRLAKMGSLAILADLLVDKRAIVNRHKKGLNVLYGNGGAHWVDLKAIDKGPWNTYIADRSDGPLDSYNTSNNWVFLDDGTFTPFSTPGVWHKPTRGVWVDLDSQ